MKESMSKYCGECLKDFTPGEIVWYTELENRSFCKTCKQKLDVVYWEKRQVKQ